MRYQPIQRRHFLQGLGASLALPFLPSLTPRAHAAPLGAPKSFIAIGSPHGNVPIEDWAPIEAPLTEVPLYAGDPAQGRDHRMRHGTLSQLTRPIAHTYNPAGLPELTKVLGNFLDPHLDKLTLIAGLDIMFDIAHHRGGFLGNFREMDNNVGNLGNLELPSMPTIDRVIARSPSFYPAGDPYAVRSMNFSNYGMDLSYDGPIGSVAELPQTGSNWTPSALDLFNALFAGVTAPSAPSDPRVSLIDRVREDYDRVINTPFGEGSRISQSDRDRLDEFVTGLRDVERRIQSSNASCGSVSPPSRNVSWAWDEGLHATLEGKWQTYLDIVVAAIQCGRSRVATIGTNHLGDDYVGDWHQDIAHRGRPDVAYDYTIRSFRFAAEKIFGYLVGKLDVSIDGASDTTYLDNALVVWNHECGQITHSSVGMPTLVAGSAGGFLRTGRFLDYRNLSNEAVLGWRSDLAHPNRPGVPYNRWLYTALQAMGIPDAEYRIGPLAAMPGYGDSYIENPSRNGHTAYSSAVIAEMGEPLHDILA